MSAFLGPVHYSMYSKIKFLDEITTRLLSLEQELNINSQLAEKINTQFGILDLRPFEVIIDQGNIHGWLSACTENTEKKFAAVVSSIFEADNCRLEPMKALFYRIGAESAIPKGSDASEAYHAIDALLLDGMPCDGGRSIISEDSEELAFQCDPTLHALCRQDEQGQELFFSLRESLLNGMLEHSALKLNSLGDGFYKISKE